jgi:catechol 2,3-dioxygenase-like lactoylglutathione lyase family enzyme
MLPEVHAMIRLIDHINIATENLAKTREFFVDVLGLEDGPRPDFGFQGHWLYAGGRAIVHLQLAREPVSASRGSALNHAAFEVGDLDALAARLDQRGIAYRMIQLPGSQVRQIFLEDPNGVLVELNSPRPAVASTVS